MRDGRVLQTHPQPAADEQFGGGVGARQFRGGGGAVFYGDFGTAGRYVGVTSDLHWVVCGDGGVLVGVAEDG